MNTDHLPGRSSTSTLSAQVCEYSTMTAPPCPPLKSLLGRHRLLAPTASVYVSPICLGGMNFGEAWKDRLGACNKETVFEILNYFYEQGGNFIDT